MRGLAGFFGLAWTCALALCSPTSPFFYAVEETAGVAHSAVHSIQGFREPKLHIFFPEKKEPILHPFFPEKSQSTLHAFFPDKDATSSEVDLVPRPLPTQQQAQQVQGSNAVIRYPGPHGGGGGGVIVAGSTSNNVAFQFGRFVSLEERFASLLPPVLPRPPPTDAVRQFLLNAAQIDIFPKAQEVLNEAMIDEKFFFNLMLKSGPKAGIIALPNKFRYRFSRNVILDVAYWKHSILATKWSPTSLTPFDIPVETMNNFNEKITKWFSRRGQKMFALTMGGKDYLVTWHYSLSPMLELNKRGIAIWSTANQASELALLGVYPWQEYMWDEFVPHLKQYNYNGIHGVLIPVPPEPAETEVHPPSSPSTKLSLS